MRVLFDHNIPTVAARALSGHQVTEAIERGWHRISNGQLIANAEAAGVNVFLTADKRIRYQQTSRAAESPLWLSVIRHGAFCESISNA